MSIMTDIEEAALVVLETEMLYTDALALRDITAPAKKIDLDSAQTAYGVAILLRTTPTGVVS